jgi:hypothetical protein
MAHSSRSIAVVLDLFLSVFSDCVQSLQISILISQEEKHTSPKTQEVNMTSDANTNSIARPNVIEWAILCTRAEIHGHGWNVTQLSDTFRYSDLAHLALLFKIAFKNGESLGARSLSLINSPYVTSGTRSVQFVNETTQGDGIVEQRPGKIDPQIPLEVPHYRLNDEWLLQLVIKDQTGNYLHAQQTEMLYTNHRIALPFESMPTMEAGHYFIEILVDSFLEHTLNLFVV